jgi:phosphatidylglycerophosphate synthase
MAPFKSPSRLQQSILTELEKKVLVRLAKSTPRSINSDHLTLLGFLAMVCAASCYVYARWNPLALIGVICFLALNWLGDSLDGTLARVRNRQRPRYGFYVDHIVDAFGALVLVTGIGLSGYMTGRVALLVIIAYFLLVIEIYLATHALGVFRLSFGMIGPTELRILLGCGTLVLLKKPIVTIAGREFLLCDIGGTVAIAVLIVIAVYSAIQNTIRLYQAEPLP